MDIFGRRSLSRSDHDYSDVITPVGPYPEDCEDQRDVEADDCCDLKTTSEFISLEDSFLISEFGGGHDFSDCKGENREVEEFPV